MATQTINFPFLAGESGLSLRLRSRTTRAIVDTQAASESTASNGIQTAAFTDVPAGQYLLQLIEGTDVLGQDTITLTLTTGQFWPDVAGSSGSSGGLTSEQAAALDRIDAKTALITGAKLSVAGAVSPGGDITLIIGDDHIVSADSELIRTIADEGGALFDRLDAADQVTFGAGRIRQPNMITGTVTATYVDDVTTLVIEIGADDITETVIPAEDYTYQIQRITSTGEHIVEVEGALTLLQRFVSRVD